MPRLSEWTLLVVDHETKVRNALERCLESDYRLIAVATVTEALEVINREEVDLVLCEHRAPHTDGVDFFRRTRISHPEIIRVLFTGDANPHDIARSINEAAVHQFVRKPWNSDQLHLLIKRALESRELARRHRYLSRELKIADEVLQRQNNTM